MRYKGKYVAKVTINFDVKVNDRMRPFEEIKHIIENDVTPAIKQIIEKYSIDDELGTAEVEQLQADLRKEADE